MKASGDTVDPALRATIEHYMSLITSRLLQTCVSYEQWNDPAGVADEARVPGFDDRVECLPGCAAWESRRVVEGSSGDPSLVK